MKFPGNMCFKIILKVTRKPGFHPLYRWYNFQKATGEGGGQFDPSGRLGLTIYTKDVQGNANEL